MSAQEQTADVSAIAFGMSLGINVAISVGLLLTFSILRPRNRNIYAPRTYMVEESKRATPLPSGWFSWIPIIFKTSDEELLHKIGLDAYMFLRFLRTSIRAFIPITILAFVVGVPLNAVGGRQNKELAMITIGNIREDQTIRLLGHAILMFIFVGIILYTLLSEMRSYVKLRHQYLISREHRREPRSVTILLTAIPLKMRNETKLRQLFDNFPGGVSHVTLARNPSGAASTYEARNTTVLSLEAAECSYIMSKGERPTTRKPVAGVPVPIPKVGEAEDAITYSRNRLEELETTLVKEREASEHATLSSAFIVFNSQRGAQLAAQAVVASKPLHMAERWNEVHPDDVIWDNLNVSGVHRWARRGISIAICVGLILAWGAITTFFMAFAKIDALAKALPFLSGLQDYPKVAGFISGVLPPVFVAVLMMVLAFILRRISVFEGIPLNSSVELSLMHKYFFFQVVNVLLVCSLSGGAIAAIGELSKDSSKIMSTLAEEMPKASSFFITYLILQGLAGAPKEILLVVPAIIKWLKRRAMVKTPRQAWELKAMPTISWGQTLPPHTLAFVIGITYSCIQPLILPFTLLYFGFYYIIYRYLFLYVLDQPSHAEMGGRTFSVTVSHIFAGLYIAEITMFGIVILNKSIAMPILMAILIGITAVANIYVENAFRALLANVPVETLLEADRGGSMSLSDIARKQHSKNDSVATSVATSFLKKVVRPSMSHDEEHEAEHGEQPLLGNGGVGLVKVSTDYYKHPALARTAPVVWLPKDAAGLADQECKSLVERGIVATTEGAEVRENGRVGINVEESPLIDEQASYMRLRRQLPKGRSVGGYRADVHDAKDAYDHEGHESRTTTTRVERGADGQQIIIEETTVTCEH